MPKPKPAVKPKNPVVKALYPYEAQDTDEISFKEGQIIELLAKGNKSEVVYSNNLHVQMHPDGGMEVWATSRDYSQQIMSRRLPHNIPIAKAK